MNLVERLLAAIKEQNRRIVIVGDVLVDRWIHGRVESCQDGCDKFVQDSVVETPGGAANAERSVCQWGVKTTLYGVSGEDRPLKCRYLVGDKIVWRADDERSRPLTGYTWARELALEMIRRAGGVLLSDYDKGFLTSEYICQVAALCQERGIPCVADVKRSPEVYAGCILKGNGAWGVKHGQQWRLHGNEHVYVETHGAEYPAVWHDGWLTIDIPNLPSVQCLNHVGAGDCFAVHLTLALAYKFSLKEAAALAHSAGRVYVQYPHSRPPHPSEIAADMDPYSLRLPSAT